MGSIVVVNEKYVAEYYKKKTQLNRLKKEVEDMSNTIKASLLENRTPTGKTYGDYTAYLRSKNKLNDKFILMLKENGMSDKITEICYMKDCEDIVESFTDKDKELYMEEWYKQLFVVKKQ